MECLFCLFQFLRPPVLCQMVVLYAIPLSLNVFQVVDPLWVSDIGGPNLIPELWLYPLFTKIHCTCVQDICLQIFKYIVFLSPPALMYRFLSGFVRALWFTKFSMIDIWPRGQGSHGHMDQGQMGQGQIRVPNKGRWAHDNVKLLLLLIYKAHPVRINYPLYTL